MNQLWIADLTYIRLLEEFVFLAAILDACSRRVIGWALDRYLDDELTLTALRMALNRRSPPPGLVHHSDRGSQYASRDYIALLEANRLRNEIVCEHRITLKEGRYSIDSGATPWILQSIDGSPAQQLQLHLGEGSMGYVRRRNPAGRASVSQLVMYCTHAGTVGAA